MHNLPSANTAHEGRAQTADISESTAPYDYRNVIIISSVRKPLTMDALQHREAEADDGDLEAHPTRSLPTYSLAINDRFMHTLATGINGNLPLHISPSSSSNSVSAVTLRAPESTLPRDVTANDICEMGRTGKNTPSYRSRALPPPPYVEQCRTVGRGTDQS